MKNIEITREQAQRQLEIDTEMEKEMANSFYSIRVSQLKDIIRNGQGIFSLHVNNEVMVTVR